ncbi:hypothetical protein D9M72_423170 [compost metagenome]
MPQGFPSIASLRKTRMTTADIADRFDYSDAANFRHTFVRWTGTSPHAYRVTSVAYGGSALFSLPQ